MSIKMTLQPKGMWYNIAKYSSDLEVEFSSGKYPGAADEIVTILLNEEQAKELLETVTEMLEQLNDR